MATRTDWKALTGRICMRCAPFLLAALLVTACGRSNEGAANLPPASGEGAPPRAELPALPKTGQDHAPAASSSRATTGTTYPRASAQVAPNASGVLAKIAVEEGDQVRKGQLLFRLRSQDFDLRVQQAQAALKSAEVGLNAVKVEYERTKRLFEKNAINQAAWDQIQAQYQSAQVGVDQARVALSMAQKARADATVRSPINGVVTAKLKNEGEMVTMMPPTVVVVVEDHSVLELRFRLPERSLRDLAAGDTVQARFSAVDLARAATVTRISPNVDMQTRTIEVIAEIPNEDGQLRAGMLAELAIGAPAEGAGSTTDQDPADQDPAAQDPDAEAGDDAEPPVQAAAQAGEGAPQ